MKIISCRSPNFKDEISSICTRESYPPDIEWQVREIVDDVRKNGNRAVMKYLLKYDSAMIYPDKFLVTGSEISGSIRKVNKESVKAIQKAIKNVREFAKKQIPKDWSFSPHEGVVTGEKFSPLERIGAYIPGGTAPLVSTVIHTVAIAAAAGVKEIVAITPPSAEGKINPAILFALVSAGATEIYKLGGVYGIAALAYGTETIRKVEKIVGPGNAYVTAAKRIVSGNVGIDMIAGPSEILIIADEDANPDFIAADMLSQAEHGSGLEQAVLITDSLKLICLVQSSITKQAESLKKNELVSRVLKNGVFFIEINKIAEAADIANSYAPEHLEIHCKDPDKIADKITAAGAIFIGEWTPEPVGDFVAGPSHVLPTAASAKFSNGLSVQTFFRRSSIIKYDRKALLKDLPAIAKFAELEGLDAHGRSASIRKTLKKQ